MAYKLSLFDKTKQRRHHDTFVCNPITQPEDHAEESRLERAEQDRRYGEAVILRFPAEIMAEIFMYSQLISIKHSADNYDLHKALDWCWITLTHVCRYWRDIAVNTQELWGYIDISQHAGIMQTKVYLERSGESPLALYVLYDEHGSNAESLGLVAHHIHRVRLLHIRAIDFSEDVLAITMKAAPKLEEFSLILDTYEKVNMQGLFAGKAPKLTSLSLGIRPMTWDNVPFMQNLRCLYISDSIETLNNIEELLTVISQIRSCEQLSIRSLLAFQELVNSVDLHQHQKRIQTPSLKYLEILDARYISLSRLFDCVEFPAIIGWKIFCRDFPYGAHERSGSVHRVIPHTSGNDQTFLSLKIVIAGDSVGIVANTKTSPVDVFQHQHCVTDLSDRRLELLRGSFSVRDGLALASSAIKGDFWCAATELELDVSRSFSDDMSLEENSWKHLLNLFPHLRTLTVWDAWSRYPSHGRVRFSCKETHHSLLSALGSPPDNIANNAVICLNLSELCLYGFEMWDNDKANHIIKFLEYRKDCGKQLDLLRVMGLDELSEENVCVLLDSGVARVIEVMSS